MVAINFRTTFFMDYFSILEQTIRPNLSLLTIILSFNGLGASKLKVKFRDGAAVLEFQLIMPLFNLLQKLGLLDT